MLGHWPEVTVVMQQFMTPIYAKGSNDYVCQASGGNTNCPQATIIVCRLYRQPAINHLHLRKTPQEILERSSVTAVASPAKNLKKNQVTEQDIAFGRLLPKSSCARSIDIPNG